MNRAVTITNDDVTTAIREALHVKLGDVRCAAKQLARRTGRNVEATRNWLEGRNAPRAAELIQLMATEDPVFEAICALAGRTERKFSEADLSTVRDALRIMEGR